MSTPDFDKTQGNADQFDFLDDEAANTPARKKKVRRSKDLVMPIIRKPVPISESGPARVAAIPDAATFDDDFEFLGDNQPTAKNKPRSSEPAWNEGIHERGENDETKSPLRRNLLLFSLGAIVLGGVATAINLYQKPDANNQASAATADTRTDAVKADAASSVTPAVKTLAQRFSEQLQNIEAQVAAGELDAAEQVLTTMDRSVYGYGAPEFSAVQQQIDNLRNGVVDSSTGTQGVKQAEQTAAAETEQARLAEVERLDEVAREEQAALARAEALRQEEAARVIEAERIAQIERDAEAQRQIAEEQALAAEALRKAEEQALAAEVLRKAEAAEAERARIAEVESARLVEAERVRIAEVEAARLVEAERIRIAEAEAARLAEAERVRNAEAEAARLAEAERVRNAEAQAARTAEVLAAQQQADQQRNQEAARVAEAARAAEVAAAALAAEQSKAAQDSLDLATTKALQRRERDRVAKLETDRRIAERARLNEERARAAEFSRQQAQEELRQRQAAENQLALNNAKDRLQITPKQENYAITDNDFNYVGGKFVELKAAIENRNIANVIALTQRSGKRVQQMLQLFENNSAIKARLVNVASRNAEGVIVGQLTIQKLVKSSGAEVDAPANLSSITLTSRRGPAGWSTIAW